MAARTKFSVISERVNSARYRISAPSKHKQSRKTQSTGEGETRKGRPKKQSKQSHRYETMKDGKHNKEGISRRKRKAAVSVFTKAVANNMNFSIRSS